MTGNEIRVFATSLLSLDQRCWVTLSSPMTHSLWQWTHVFHSNTKATAECLLLHRLVYKASMGSQYMALCMEGHYVPDEQEAAQSCRFLAAPPWHSGEHFKSSTIIGLLEGSAGEESWLKQISCSLANHDEWGHCLANVWRGWMLRWVKECLEWPYGKGTRLCKQKKWDACICACSYLWTVWHCFCSSMHSGMKFSIVWLTSAAILPPPFSQYGNIWQKCPSTCVGSCVSSLLSVCVAAINSSHYPYQPFALSLKLLAHYPAVFPDHLKFIRCDWRAWTCTEVHNVALF